MLSLLRGRPWLAWVSLLAAALLLAGTWLVRVPETADGPVQGRGQGPVPMVVLPGQPVLARFTVSRPGLRSIKIKVATYQRRNRCSFKAELLSQGRRVARTKTTAYWFPDLDWIRLTFFFWGSRLPAGEYELKFTSPDSDPTNSVAVLGHPDQGTVLLVPVFQVRSRTLGDWLARRRPDYGLLLNGLIGLLAGGGLLTWIFWERKGPRKSDAGNRAKNP